MLPTACQHGHVSAIKSGAHLGSRRPQSCRLVPLLSTPACWPRSSLSSPTSSLLFSLWPRECRGGLVSHSSGAAPLTCAALARIPVTGGPPPVNLAARTPAMEVTLHNGGMLAAVHAQAPCQAPLTSWLGGSDHRVSEPRATAHPTRAARAHSSGCRAASAAAPELRRAPQQPSLWAPGCVCSVPRGRCDHPALTALSHTSTACSDLSGRPARLVLVYHPAGDPIHPGGGWTAAGSRCGHQQASPFLPSS